MTPQISTSSSASGLRVLSLFMGVFFLFMGLDKLGWLTDPDLLTKQLNTWLETAPAASRWYFRTVAIPGAPVFARLVLVGELATAAALLTGFQTRLAAVAGLFMVLNFHFAMGVLLQVQLPLERVRPTGARQPRGTGHRWCPFAVQRVQGSRQVPSFNNARSLLRAPRPLIHGSVEM